MKLETLAWVAFVLFSVMHALRFGNGNKLSGCVAVANRPFSNRPATEPRCLAAPREIPIKLCLFVTEKQPTSIAIGWSEPVCGREFYPLKASGFQGAL